MLRPVVTTTVQPPLAGRERTFSGLSKAALDTDLAFRVGGKIEKLAATVGLEVQPGTLVARLDETDAKLQVAQLRAQKDRTHAQLTEARSEFERVGALYDAGNASLREYEKAQASLDSAKSQHESTLRSLELSEKQLEYHTLLAPADGTISAVPVETHQIVTAGQPVATLTSFDRIEVELGVPEAVIAGINSGDAARVAFDALADMVFDARVTKVGVTTTESSTYPVTLLLESNDSRIRPQMSCEASFTLQSAAGSEHVHIPAVAVFTNPAGEHFVWVFTPDPEGGDVGTVSRRHITQGALTSWGLQVTSGLQPGETIVVRGVHRIENGQRVRLLDS